VLLAHALLLLLATSWAAHWYHSALEFGSVHRGETLNEGISDAGMVPMGALRVQPNSA